MTIALTNVSFDGKQVQFRMDSPQLVCFDPLALDMLRDLLPGEGPFDLGELLERANANHAAVSCYTIPDFQAGIYTLDPRDIQKCGDEEQDFDYCEGVQGASEPDDKAPSFPFVGVDSGMLVFADVMHLPKLVRLLTWEQYDLALQGHDVFPDITEALGGPYFALIVSDAMLGIQFDGDGSYTIAPACVRRSRG